MQHESLTPSQLRREINARAETYARNHRLLYDLSVGTSPAVIFGCDEHGRHGNFHPDSYGRICATPECSRRLNKPHTASRRSMARKDWRWMELDSACSSDALLMNIFCHPEVFDDGGLAPAVAHLLGVETNVNLHFGSTPGIPLRDPLKPRSKKEPERQRLDRTEVDLALGDLLLEAKLTESNFQTASPDLLARYRDLDAVFLVERLPRRVLAGPPLSSHVDPEEPTLNLPKRAPREHLDGYQLVRNVLAAYESNSRFCILSDSRRRDLIEIWFSVLSAIRSHSFTTQLRLLTWQDLAVTLPPGLQSFLAEKYGIEPAF